MSHDVQESPIGGAEIAGETSASLRSDKRLFNTEELRLLRYTSVLLPLFALAALLGIIVWSFAWGLNAFYNLLLS